jgi:hypothetical protein
MAQIRLPDQLWNNFRHLRLAKARRTLAEKRGRAVTIAEPMGQGWLQLSEFGLAFGLSALIRFGREVHHKSADLPTYALVGLACALILLASKCGFTNVLESNRLVLDPARIAVQIAIATTAAHFSWSSFSRPSNGACRNRAGRPSRSMLPIAVGGTSSHKS